MPVVVRSADAIDRVPLERLVTLATVVDLRDRPNTFQLTRGDLAKYGVADIGGCILFTGWCDGYLAGERTSPPELSVEAAAYLLEGGVRTVAADFPIVSDAADLLLQNNCVLVHCISNVSTLGRGIVRLIALPSKLEDTSSAEARVIAMEDP